MAYDLLLCNMHPKKRNSHFITYRSGNTACVISKEHVFTDVMVIAEEVVAVQQQLVGDMLIDMLPQIKPQLTPPACLKV